MANKKIKAKVVETVVEVCQYCKEAACLKADPKRCTLTSEDRK